MKRDISSAEILKHYRATNTQNEDFILKKSKKNRTEMCIHIPVVHLQYL